jgi:hypothetical protein
MEGLRMFRNLIAGCALCCASIASADSWTLNDYGVFVGDDHVVLRLSGGSDTGCSPAGPFVESGGGIVTIAFEWQPPTGPCFSAPMPWHRVVVIDDLIPGINEVRVIQDDTLFGQFSIDWTPASPTLEGKREYPPAQGMWWSSEGPGTGLAFNVDNEGRWFAALYLYNDLGNPMFMTMQGDSLAYGSEGIDFAAAVSPLIHSEGGQCLACPWSAPSTSDTGHDAVLIFQSRTFATLRVGSWGLDLTPLPMTLQEGLRRPIPVPDAYYQLTVDGPEGRHVATARGLWRPAAGFLGASASGLGCVECRTVDDGASPPESDGVLVALVDNLRFGCPAIRPPCHVFLDNRSTILQIDDSGQTITATFAPDEPERRALSIRLDRLPDDWR